MKNFFFTAMVTFSILSASAAMAADSTANTPGPFIAASQTYLLASGTVATQIGDYQVRIATTDERCFDSTSPLLITSLNGIQQYGASQAIEGVINTLALNNETYEIKGLVHAPVNVKPARPNGVSVNWEIWCKPNAIA